MFSKIAAVSFLFSNFAFAAPIAPVTLNFADKHLSTSLTWLMPPQVETTSANGAVDPTSASVMALQWTGNPSSFRVDVSMDMDGTAMNAPSPTMVQDRPGRFHSYTPGSDPACAAGSESNCTALYFEMKGTWDICVVVHPDWADKETSCTSVTIQ